MRNNKIKSITIIAIIAALYTTVSLSLAPLTYGNIQVRIAEALTLLPLLYMPSIYGVVLGCALTNLIGAMMGINLLGFLDVFIGTFATFIAAFYTYKFKDILLFKQPVLSALMPVLFNALIIGAQLSYVLFAPSEFMLGWLIFATQVALGQFIACVIFGLPLINALKKVKLFEKIV